MSDTDVIRTGYEAFSRRDLEGWLSGFHADAELHEFADHPDAASFHGHEGLRKWVRVSVDDVTEEGKFEVNALVEGPGTVLADIRFVARELRSGREFSFRVFHVFEMSDGKVARVSGYHDEKEARAAAGL